MTQEMGPVRAVEIYHPLPKYFSTHTTLLKIEFKLVKCVFLYKEENEISIDSRQPSKDVPWVICIRILTDSHVFFTYVSNSSRFQYHQLLNCRSKLPALIH